MRERDDERQRGWELGRKANGRKRKYRAYWEGKRTENQQNKNRAGRRLNHKWKMHNNDDKDEIKQKNWEYLKTRAREKENIRAYEILCI